MIQFVCIILTLVCAIVVWTFYSVMVDRSIRRSGRKRDEETKQILLDGMEGLPPDARERRMKAYHDFCAACEKYPYED